MKRKTIILLFILSCYATQPSSEKIPAVIYHFEGSQEAYGIEEAHDGKHYIISGWTDEGGKYYPPRCMLLKINKEGKLIERKIYENLEWDCGLIIKLKDNTHYILRSSDNLTKFNNNLQLIFKKYFPNMTYSFITDVIDLHWYDLVYISALYSKSIVYRIDYDGFIKDSLVIQAKSNRSSVIEVDGNGRIYIAIQENDTSTNKHGYKFIKLNSNLDTIATNFIDVKSLFGYSAGYITAMESFGDGSLLISALIVRGFLDGFSALFKVDSMGNILKYKTIDYSLASVDGMTKLRDGNIALIGSALKDGRFFTFVMKLRPDLSVVWYREYLIDNSVFYGTIVQDSDGNLVLAGYIPNYDDIAFMKLDAKTGEPLIWQEY